MELNKIAAAILVAGLIALIAGKVSLILYHGSGQEEHGEETHVARGYAIEGADAFEAGAGGAAGGAAEEELASIIPLLKSADVAAGEKIFQTKCSTCHTDDKGGANKTGPNQWNLVNRKVGGHEGFNYSKAMSAHSGNWGYDELNAFIHKPKKYVPGTIMAFAGIAKEQDRANLIAYLRGMSDSPAPIPDVPAAATKTDAPAKAAEPVGAK